MTRSLQFSADVLDFTSGAADAETTVAHTLIRTPLEAFVVWQGASGFLYRSTTAWDATNIYVKSSVDGVAYRIFLI